jgi:trehalose/maltose hydrolase-like predicted phosphorylase
VLERDGRFHIRGVVGPDEYHPGVDDNAYTNGMASWNLRCGARVARLVARRWPDRMAALAAVLELGPDEPARWEALAAATYDGFDAKTGLIEQFAGYFQREDIDLDALEPRMAPVDLLLGARRTADSQVCKQPDVLMLLQLLPEQFAPEVHRACFAYYDRRTGHGSSLSPPIHALLAARNGDRDATLRYLRMTAAIDLEDPFGNAAGGVHVGALGGLWQAIVFGLAGLRFTEAGPTLAPCLPAGVTGLTFPFLWQERRWRAEIRGGNSRLVETP